MTAARISTRYMPNVRSSSAGRAAIRIANRANPIPATSVNKCPASARRARLFVMIPPITSIKRSVRVIPNTNRRRARCRDAALVQGSAALGAEPSCAGSRAIRAMVAGRVGKGIRAFVPRRLGGGTSAPRRRTSTALAGWQSGRGQACGGSWF